VEVRWSFCEAAFEKAGAMCSGVSGCAAGLDAPYRARLRKPAVAYMVDCSLYCVDPCQMHCELDAIVISVIRRLIDCW
jgi:hypothetical protein